MKEKRETYNQFMIYLNHAKKILSLDADFGIRSCWFLKTIAPVKIIVNNWNKSPRTFRIMDQEIRFMEMLENDLGSGKRVVVVTMPSKKGEQVIEETKSLAESRGAINTSLTKKKHLLKSIPEGSVFHSSGSDDKLKEMLKDGEKFWTKFRFDCIHSYD